MEQTAYTGFTGDSVEFPELAAQAEREEQAIRENTSFLEELEAESERAAAQAPPDTALMSVRILAERLQAQQKTVLRLEKELAEAKEALRLTERRDLPNAMAEIRMGSFTLLDGSEVGVESEVYTQISGPNAAEAFAWVRAQGEEGIIKTKVEAVFGKGEDDKAAALRAVLQERGLPFTAKEDIHASTLKAWVKNRLAADAVEASRPEALRKLDYAPLPKKLFGVFEEKVAKISVGKVAKKPKGKR